MEIKQNLWAEWFAAGLASGIVGSAITYVIVDKKERADKRKAELHEEFCSGYDAGFDFGYEWGALDGKDRIAAETKKVLNKDLKKKSK